MHARELVGVQLRKHELLRQAQAVAAVTVEGLAADAAKVADARQGQRNQPVEKLVHLAAAERDLAADLHPFTEAEGGNGLAGDRDDRLLAGNQAHRLGGGFQVLLFLRRGPDAHVDDDLFQSRQRQLVLAAELFGERGNDLLEVLFLEARRRNGAGGLFG